MKLNILDRYPTPWTVNNSTRCIQDKNGKFILYVNQEEIKLLEFITETINNSVKPRITDVSCNCDCGWQGTVGETELDIDGDGSLSKANCLNIVRAIV